MDDPLKRYVRQNREAFDRMEPSEAVLQRLKGRLNAEKKPKKGMIAMRKRGLWLVAASLLLGLALTYVLLYQTDETLPTQQIVMTEENTLPPTVDTPAAVLPAEPAVEMPVVEPKAKRQQPRSYTHPPEETPASPTLAWHAQLADTNSASTRLAAILDIEQAGQLDDELIALVANVMNQDGNTNVRLAALDLLGKHAHERPHITELFITSLATQTDPFVQLGLIHSLKQVDREEVDQTLYALADNPNTFNVVKDEAYAVLLYQNKL